MHVRVPLPGSIVWIRQRRWRVESARLDRSVVRLDVADRGRRLTFLAPFDRPDIVERLPRPRYVRPPHLAARLAGLIARAPAAGGLPAALGADVEILPHQLEPALAVVSGVRRVLIADDVGLGKTIQAALVIAELRRRTPCLRALVVVPASLRDQWREELLRRFEIRAELVDRPSIELSARNERYASNPWSRSGIWIASVDYLKQPHVLDAMPLRPWDVVVIDEAHETCGGAARREACDDLARRARHLLLLTATPHSGDRARFDHLTRIGQLSEADHLTFFRRTRASLRMAANRRVRWSRVAPSREERLVLDALADFERAVLHAAAERRDAAVLLLSIFRKRALSTMTALHRSIERRLAWIGGSHDPELLSWWQPRLDFEETDRGDDDCEALAGLIDLAAGLERAWLRRLRHLAQTALASQSKVKHLVRLMCRTHEPVVVFTEFRHSLEAIERALSGHRRVAALHGGMSAMERGVAIERFAGGDADVLLATDVASQGLNLQRRCRWIVSVELPWNPVRLEQRIGRVDRIGQPRAVHASLLVSAHHAEDDLLAHLARRVLNARRTLGPEMLSDVPLPERTVARALLAGGNVEPSHIAAASATSSCEWARRARALARQLHAGRACARRWRGPLDGGRPCWTRARRTTADSTLVVVSVPLVDGTGLVIERRFFALRCNGFHRNLVTALAGSDALRAHLLRRLRARIARIRRLARVRAETRMWQERAIDAHLHMVSVPEAAQPGLFSRQNARAWDTAHERASERLGDIDARAERIAAGAEIHVGTPVVEAVVCHER